MTIFTLMAGVLIAAGLFASLIWSVQRVFVTRGMPRYSYACMGFLILAAMAALSLEWSAIARLTGLLLLPASGGVAWFSDRWSRLLSLPPLALGAVLAMGLPFSPA